MVEPSGHGPARGDIVMAARGWIGTPYLHQASLKGAGSDCLGLVRGVWRDIYGADAEEPPAYSRDWAEASGLETMLAAAGRHLQPVAIGEGRAGDVVVFRLREGTVAKHAGLISVGGIGGEAWFIHAMEGHAVAEVPLAPWWRRRIAGVFAFPGVRD